MASLDTSIVCSSALSRKLQRVFQRGLGTERSLSTLKSVLAEKIPAKQAELAKLKKEHGHKSVGEVGAARHNYLAALQAVQ